MEQYVPYIVFCTQMNHTIIKLTLHSLYLIEPNLYHFTILHLLELLQLNSKLKTEVL